MCARNAARDRARRTAGGFSLLELTIVGTIIAIVGSIALPQYASALHTARIGKARHELATLARIENALGHGGVAYAYGRARAAAACIVAGTASVGVLPKVEADTLAVSLAAVPTFHVFIGVDANTTRRRDGFMFPLNSDYDLFSLGPDGRTAVSLGQPMARDDVIRANDGGFFGTASEY